MTVSQPSILQFKIRFDPHRTDITAILQGCW